MFHHQILENRKKVRKRKGEEKTFLIHLKSHYFVNVKINLEKKIYLFERVY